MLFLLLAVACSAVVIHCFRFAQAKGYAVDRLLLVNYLMAASVGWLQSSASSIPSGKLPALLALGLVTGTLFIGTFYLLDHGVRKLGPSVATAAARMSSVVPVGLSVLIFHENPAWYAWLGIALALLALPLSLPGTPKSSPRWSLRAVLPGLLIFLSFGINDFMLKVQNEGFPGETKSLFLAIVYSTALAIAALRLAFQKRSPGKGGWGPWLVGALLGVANYYSTAFLSLALGQLPGSQAYTLGSIGSILLVTVTSLWLWKEPIGRRKVAFLALAAVAILLIGLPQ